MLLDSFHLNLMQGLSFACVKFIVLQNSIRKFENQQEVVTTYNRAFLTPLFALIKTLRDI